MALLDRFRTRPNPKHPDPAVRLGLVQEISIDERDLLAEIARGDADARVRRAAVGKLMDPAALAVVARSDADPGVREEATAMLRDIALDAFEGVAEADSLAAVEGLSDSKTLAFIAKSSLREGIARQALDRLNDPRAIGSIARHAQLEPIRLAACAALSDCGEILNVAINSDFKDVSVAAVERLAERAGLDQVAARAKNKSAAKRARGILREMDERIAAQAAANAPPSSDPEEIAREESAAAARRAELAEMEDARRQAAAGEQAEADAARQREEAEAARQRGEAQAIEHRRQDEAADEQRRKEMERRSGRLIELLQEAEAAADNQDLATAKRRFHVVRREWKDLTAGVPADTSAAERYAAAENRFSARECEAAQQEERARREALMRVRQLLGRVEPLVEKADLSLQIGARALRDVRAALADTASLPSKRDYDEVVHRLKAAQGALAPKVQELRDVADWQRWANVGIQEQLCEKMEALRAVEDPEQIARQVHELQRQWREAADVPRPQGEALWRRFKAAHDEVWPRCEAHFAADAGRRSANLATKVAICERAEALSGSTNWIQTAEEVKRLQAEWKAIGPVTRGQEKATWDRFRTACDRFFTRREADLSDRKKRWAENLAKKDALCAQAEALADSTDWETAAAAVKRLQAEWKTIGPVKKNRSEAIWQRFRGACDRFFTRYAQRHDIARGERVAAREAICGELEALAASGPEAAAGGADPAPTDLLPKVRTLRVRWQQELAARGVDRERAVALDERFNAAFALVIATHPSAFAGTDLDSGSNTKRMETLVRRMEDLAASLFPSAAVAGEALSPPTRLAAMLKEALAANTIGGKVDEASRFRAASEEVWQAQASWSRLGPVPEQVRRPLADRFSRACARIVERAGGAGRTAR